MFGFDSNPGKEKLKGLTLTDLNTPEQLKILMCSFVKIFLLWIVFKITET